MKFSRLLIPLTNSEQVTRKAIEYAVHAKRNMVDSLDILYAVRQLGQAVYGFEDPPCLQLRVHPRRRLSTYDVLQKPRNNKSLTIAILQAVICSAAWRWGSSEHKFGTGHTMAVGRRKVGRPSPCKYSICVEDKSCQCP